MQSVTMRGKMLDMGKLIAQNSHKKALGNAKMNARGDIIDPYGKVLVAREAVAREYHKTNPKAIKQVPLRNINQEVVTFDTPAQAVMKQKELLASQQASQQVKPKRKISD
jgi:hypothetical protein